MKKSIIMLICIACTSCGALYTIYGTKSLSYRIDNDTIKTQIINHDTISLKTKMPLKK